MELICFQVTNKHIYFFLPKEGEPGPDVAVGSVLFCCRGRSWGRGSISWFRRLRIGGQVLGRTYFYYEIGVSLRESFYLGASFPSFVKRSDPGLLFV